ncbi:MAG: peptide chain release factor N(5)-glutamine methyltransferase [Bacteroidaceae bacterium]|nr:peptide chain release factor N(5)-glutamine methyltransferase [Bacteroidaceae bacterium]
MNYSEYISLLTPLHGRGEATAIVRTVMEERFGLSLSDLLLGKDKALSAKDRQELEKIMHELLSGAPVQYVLGSATFRGKRFLVSPDVLIPRPETEMLTDLIPFGSVVADLGTGSGCIAISAALEREPKQTVAVDVSEKALNIARQNAALLGADIEFLLQDMLDADALCSRLPQLDCIVSNPPYVRQSERETMSMTVSSFEPPSALFVPDDDPLLFYRAIATVGQRRLRHGGIVAVEVNTSLAADVARLFSQMEFSDSHILRDCFDKERFVVCELR